MGSGFYLTRSELEEAVDNAYENGVRDGFLKCYHLSPEEADKIANKYLFNDVKEITCDVSD